MDDYGQEIEQTTLAAETEVALEVSRRLPLLLVAVGLMAICCVVCWRRMRRSGAVAPVEWMPYPPKSDPTG